MRHWALLLLLAVVAGGFALRDAGTPAGTDGAAAVTGQVERVVDGDTIHVRVDGRLRKVRLFGVDAPETTALRNGSAECAGQDAKALARRLARGTVTLRADSRGDRVDRFGRWLRYVEREGDDVGRALVLGGLAEVYRFEGRSFDRAGRYDAAAALAERRGRGVHARCGGEFHRPR